MPSRVASMALLPARGDLLVHIVQEKVNLDSLWQIGAICGLEKGRGSNQCGGGQRSRERSADQAHALTEKLTCQESCTPALPSVATTSSGLAAALKPLGRAAFPVRLPKT